MAESRDRCRAVTKSGRECRNYAIAPNGFCKIHQIAQTAEQQIAEARKNGRPLILTEEIIEEVCKILRRGSYLETAAAWIGVTYRSIARWRNVGRAEVERVEREIEAGNTDARISPSKLIYVRFFHATERAISESDVRDLTNIEAAAQMQWQASAWRLERRHPEQWGRPWRPEEAADPDEGKESPVLVLADQMRREAGQ